jgi:hypothetical protein
MTRLATVVLLVLLGSSVLAESVKITLPASVAFAVTNVSVATTGSPNPTPVSFSVLSVTAGHALRISVKADADFTPPSGTAIPASNVSWTTSAPSNGVGSNGTLSNAAYVQLFQNTLGKNNGGVSVAWTLAAPGTPLRAGNHLLTLRWKVEAITP